MNIPVLYQDNHVLVVEKPPGVPSQADPSGDPDVLTLLKDQIKRDYDKPGNVYLGLVHRLDRPVGGVMVYARTSKAASRLSEQVRDKKMKKSYLAVVVGTPKEAKGTLVDWLLKNSQTNMVRVVKEGVKRAQQAVLHYEVLASAGHLSLVRIQLETGRPHQIRVQMSHLGCPLVGDAKYGHERGRSYEIALWSYQLGFTHPTTKEWMEFESFPDSNREPWKQFQDWLRLGS